MATREVLGTILAGEKIEPAKARSAPRVVNLMEALLASLDGEKGAGTVWRA